MPLRGSKFLLEAHEGPWGLESELMLGITFYTIAIKTTRCVLNTISFETKEGLPICC
jgi:hypothetical protein